MNKNEAQKGIRRESKLYTKRGKRTDQVKNWIRDPRRVRQLQIVRDAACTILSITGNGTIAGYIQAVWAVLSVLFGARARGYYRKAWRWLVQATRHAVANVRHVAAGIRKAFASKARSIRNALMRAWRWVCDAVTGRG